MTFFSVLRIALLGAVALVTGLMALVTPPSGQGGGERLPTFLEKPPLDQILATQKRYWTEKLAATPDLAHGNPIYLRVFKQDYEVEVWMQGKPGKRWQRVAHYPICAWSGSLGPKLREGDGQSPEGFYTVTTEQLNPDSQFHLSFNLGFPNAYDQAFERTGSLIMMHGRCGSIGCFAMGDGAIERIYALVDGALAAGQKGVPIHVFPFRMEEAAMAAHADSAHLPFWANLKQGYDAFAATGAPPQIAVTQNAGNPHYQVTPVTP